MYLSFITVLTKENLEVFLVTSFLSSISTSTQQTNFYHAQRIQCSKSGLSNPPWAELHRRRPECLDRKAPLHPGLHLLHELACPFTNGVCHIGQDHPTSALVDASSHRSVFPSGTPKTFTLSHSYKNYKLVFDNIYLPKILYS